MEMYLNPRLAALFASSEKEDTESNSRIAQIIDSEFSKLYEDARGVHIANLGAGANPQKYQAILQRIRSHQWRFDWVDLSRPMLAIAQETARQYRLPKDIQYIHNDFIGYLISQRDESLDGVFMQYCINYLTNLDVFFGLLSQKLRKGGVYVANLGLETLENFEEARFLVNGKEIHGPVALQPGDVYTICFLKQNGRVYATTQKNFFSSQEILRAAHSNGLLAKIEPHQQFTIVQAKKH